MAENWVAKTVGQMTCRKAHEWWETKPGNCEVTSQALWPAVKLLMERGGSKTPTTLHGPLGIRYHLNEKADMIAKLLEN